MTRRVARVHTVDRGYNIIVLRYNSRRSASLFLCTRARFAAAARVGSVGSVGCVLLHSLFSRPPLRRIVLVSKVIPKIRLDSVLEPPARAHDASVASYHDNLGFILGFLSSCTNTLRTYAESLAILAAHKNTGISGTYIRRRRPPRASRLARRRSAPSPSAPTPPRSPARRHRAASPRSVAPARIPSTSTDDVHSSHARVRNPHPNRADEASMMPMMPMMMMIPSRWRGDATRARKRTRANERYSTHHRVASSSSDVAFARASHRTHAFARATTSRVVRFLSCSRVCSKVVVYTVRVDVCTVRDDSGVRTPVMARTRRITHLHYESLSNACDV